MHRRTLATVSKYQPNRWRTEEERRVARTVWNHYFPRNLEGTKKRTAKTVAGVSLSDAIKTIRDRCTKEKLVSDIILQAKVRLAGENANGVRGVLTFAKTLNSDISVLVFCPEPQWADAKLAGAKYAGSLELVPDILEDKLQFDRCIATVDQVPVIAKLARVLGPKGLMPNAKTGTLTTDVVGAVKAALLNTPFKVEKDTALFRIAIAKPSFSETDLKANLKIVMDYLLSQNRTTDDGKFVESAQLSVDTFSVEISRSEYGQSSGPKYMLALEKLRAQIAARPKLAM